MKIHHLNCGSINPPLIDVPAIVYCLLVETSLGPVLVDTGFGTRDYRQPSGKMRFFLSYMNSPRRMEETALYQIQRLGFQPDQVRHIIQTHLHIDHAGGLADFPAADVHICDLEFAAIQQPRGLMEFGYDQSQWSHQPNWVLHHQPVVDWYGFEAVPVLETPEADFMLIPLPGHTRGHCGVAIGKPGSWLLHCGDAASPFHPGSDLHRRGKEAYLLEFIPQGLVSRILGGHIGRLRALLESHGDEIRAVSAHDIYSYREYNQIKTSK